jgi:lipopolysaccharide transport protein LptA
MAAWQRRVRLVVAAIGIASVGVVVWQFKGRPDQQPATAVPRLDPKAIMQTGPGQVSRTNLALEHGTISFESSRRYTDNSTRLSGVTIVTTRNERTFTITAPDAEMGQNEAEVKLEGGVRVEVSDGMTITMPDATYNRTEGTVHAPGVIGFSRGRMKGTATGVAYNEPADILTLMEKVSVTMAPDRNGDALRINAKSAEFNRPEKVIRFNGAMNARRQYETMEADNGVAYLTDDEQTLKRLELRGNSRIGGSRSGQGAMRALRGTDIDLDYAEGGQAIKRAALRGNAMVQVSGEAAAANGAAAGRRGVPAKALKVVDREIIANDLDVGLAPDGSTPTGIVARENVRLTVPSDGQEPTRIITDRAMDAVGDDARGLTSARFAGGVKFEERGSDLSRDASSNTLDVTLAPGLSSIEDAQFVGGVRFVEKDLTATAAQARYVLDKDSLHLSGSEPAARMPSIRDDRIAVDAPAIDVVLNGPQIRAGDVGQVGQVGKQGPIVKSVLSAPPKQESADRKTDPKVPSMLKEDQPVNINSRSLSYDGTASRAVFDGEVFLFQKETSIRAANITIDDRTGDLTAIGGVTTNVVFVREDKDKKKTREKSAGAAREFRYEEAQRKATYTGKASLNGFGGDLSAESIELYLDRSGDEVERVIGRNTVKFVMGKRDFTGSFFEYLAADERYELTGKPMVATDSCGNKTNGLKLTYLRATDTTTIEGGPMRVSSQGTKEKCD